MSLQQTTRGLEDLLYTLGSSLEKFKGVNGLQRLVTTGKLSLLSLFGEFERTKNEVYEKRSEAMNETRRCLGQIIDEFDSVRMTTQKLVRKVDHLLSTLENFHQACDLEIDDRSSTQDADAQQLLSDFAQIQTTNGKLKEALNDFSMSTSTCADLARGAVAQLEEVNINTSCYVSAALTDFDRQRRRVQVKENDVTTALSRATSRQDPAVQFAEYSFLKESESLEAYGKKYIDVLATAMSSTKFSLEQSSMTGWASSNVFFVQLALLFHEMAGSGHNIAANLLSIKNAQKISRQLTDEKRSLMQQQQRASTAAYGPQGPSSFANNSYASEPATTVAAARTEAPPFAPSPPTQQIESAALPQPLHALPRTSQPALASSGSPSASHAVDLDDLFN